MSLPGTRVIRLRSKERASALRSATRITSASSSPPRHRKVAVRSPGEPAASTTGVPVRRTARQNSSTAAGPRAAACSAARITGAVSRGKTAAGLNLGGTVISVGAFTVSDIDMRIGIPKNACNEARKVRLAYHLPGRAGRGLLAAGCSSGAAEAPADGGETRTVEHIYGESEVPAEPERVVAVSVTSTPVLLSLDLPVVAAGTTGPSALTDDKGFFAQWAETADERGVEALPGPEPDVIVGNGFGADAVDEATYDKLSEIAPTVVYGESDTPWLELTEEVAGAFGAEDRAAEIAKEYEDLTAEAAGQLEDAGEIAAMTGTPEKFFVFTPESAQGRFFADLGLT